MLSNCPEMSVLRHEMVDLRFYGQSTNLHDAITTWTRACDKRLASFDLLHSSSRCECKQYCHVGNTAQQCTLGLFQDSDFAGDLEDSKIDFRWNIVRILEVIHLFQ